MESKTILVVDDEPHVRYLLEFKVGGAGYTVITAANGDQAYELACAHRPDLVVTDLQMPKCSGLELCMRLKENPDTAAIPAVMLTGRGYKVPPSDLAKTNIKQMMDKPFSPREIIALIREVLDEAAPSDGTPQDEAGATAA